MPHILVIDDEPEIRAALKKTLTAAGYSVAVAEDGREGVKLHRAAPADLVIIDLFMPTQEGLETIQLFHKQSPEVQIIAMSGNPGGMDMLQVAREFGANEALLKPFGADEILALVKKLLASREE